MFLELLAGLPWVVRVGLRVFAGGVVWARAKTVGAKRICRVRGTVVKAFFGDGADMRAKRVCGPGSTVFEIFFCEDATTTTLFIILEGSES